VNGVLHLVESQGLVLLGLVIFLESMGLPLPGETALLLSAFLARQGHLDIRAVLVVASAAAILGDNVGFGIARAGGRQLLARHGSRILLTPARMRAAERFFERHGGPAVFLARWTAGLRVAGAWAAGLSGMNWRTFLAWNAIGGIAWATVVGLLGYWLGASYEVGARYLGFGEGVLIGAIVLVAGVAWLRRRRERADPGPGPDGRS
jgi:membrane protein DedA with SNARE-associated domain